MRIARSLHGSISGERGSSRALAIIIFALFSAVHLPVGAAVTDGGYIPGEDFSPSLEPGEFVIRNWTVSSGLPNNSVQALLCTGDGYIWIGTPSGLIRFDGDKFKTFNRWNTEQLASNNILSLYEDIYGVLWIGTSGGGLVACSGNEWIAFGSGQGFLDEHVRAVTGDWHGRLWAGTEYGLHRLDGDMLRIFGLDDGLADNLVTSLAVDGFGNLWAGTMRGGLAQFGDGLVRGFSFFEGLSDERVLSLAAGPEGDIWIGTMNGLFRLPHDRGVVEPVHGTGDYPVTSLVFLPDGRLLVGTMVEGVKILGSKPGAAGDRAAGPAGGRVPAGLLDESEFSTSHIRAILSSPGGSVWIGTESDGLIQLARRRASTLSCSEQMPDGPVYPLLEVEGGDLWAGTEKSGLCRLSGGRVERRIDRSNGLAGNMVRALMEGTGKRIWVGTMDGGLSIVSEGGIRNITSKEGLPSDNVTAISQDAGKRVWIGTQRGLCSCAADGGDVAVVPEMQGEPVRILYLSGDGSILAGTRSGLWSRRQDADAWSRLGEEEADIISIFEDQPGEIWAGTNGVGLKRYTDGRLLSTYGRSDGLPGDFIYSVSAGHTAEAARRLWMSCENGVFSVDRDSLAAYSEGKVLALAPTLYNGKDGMPSGRCSGPCSPAFCVTADGRRLYPTAAGIAVLETAGMTETPGDTLSPTSGRPLTLIESVTADGIELTGSSCYFTGSFSWEDRDEPDYQPEPFRIDAGAERISIGFTAIEYDAPERCRFVCRLGRKDGKAPGGDESLIYRVVLPGQKRSVTYSGLSPGEYIFAVRAIGNSGLWSEGYTAARFAIVRPFYRSPVFILLLVVLLLGFGTVLLILAGRRSEKEAGSLKKYSTSSIGAERMAEAEEELRALLEEEKIFLDPDLTLKKLAKKLNIHSNHLSRIINEKQGMSFNHYINLHRIGEAQKRLTDPAFDEKTITDIMYDVGFYSKSTFNTAFKKVTGFSPSEYRKKHS